MNTFVRAARYAACLLAFVLAPVCAADKSGAAAPLAVPQMSISDATITEGNAGTKYAVFTVSLSSPATSYTTFDIATADVSAIGNDDFQHAYGNSWSIDVGQSSATIAILIFGDTVIEPTETFEVQLSNVTNATLADGVGVGTIVNDDSGAAASLLVGDVRIAEGNSGSKNAVFTVSLSKAAATAVSFNIATANGTATAGTDYTALNLTAQSIPAGQTSKTFSVAIAGDTTAETDETFFVNLSNASGAAVTRAQALGTIANDDNVSATKISIDDLWIDHEGNSGTQTVSFTVRLSKAATAAVTFDIKTEDGSATAGSDYVAKALVGQTIAIGQTTKTFSVVINGDTVPEPEERFSATLSNVVNAAVQYGDTHGVAQIPNDDAEISIADVSAMEGDSGETYFQFVVSLSAPVSDGIMFQVKTCDGTAHVGEDYWGESGSNWFQIPPFATVAGFGIAVKGDYDLEADETFCVDLQNVSAGVALGDTHSVATILNDDVGVPSMTVGNPSMYEGDFDYKILKFPVTLAHASQQTVTLNYHTAASGTATPDTDFQPVLGGSISVQPGVTSFELEVGVVGDWDQEADETIVMVLDSATGATLTNGTATGTILNDDTGAGPVEISVNDVSLVEGNSGGSTMDFTVSLNRASNSDITFDAFTGSWTAIDGSDYGSLSLYGVVIPAGQTSKTISVTIGGDTDPEGDETFTLSLQNVHGAVVADNVGMGTIVDDDLVNQPGLSIGDVSIAEGEMGYTTATFTVSLSAPSTYDVSFNLASADGTATTAAYDYVQLSYYNVVIPAGTTSKTFSVSIYGDNTYEEDESFFINLSDVRFAHVDDGQAVVTILNDDLKLPTMTVEDVSYAEGNGGQTYPKVTIRLSEPAPQMVSFDVQTAYGTATPGVDYSGFNFGYVTIPAGETSITLEFTLHGDVMPEPDETFNVYAHIQSGALPGKNTGTVTILNDDGAVPPPQLTITDPYVFEDGVARFEAKLAYVSDQAVTFNYATSDGTALAGQDYVASTGLATIPLGQTSIYIDVPIIDDTLVESAETFTLGVSNVVGAAAPAGPATATLLSNDLEPPTISVNDASVVEASQGRFTGVIFTISLSHSTNVPVTVNLTTADGTAKADLDYFAQNATPVTIQAGQTSTTFRVGVPDDQLDEPDETFTLNLSAAVNGTIADGQGVGTIVDNDEPAGPTLSINDVSVSEGDSGTKNATFTVSLTAPAAAAVTFDVGTNDGSANDGTDYVGLFQTGLTIPAGETSKTVSVVVKGDTDVESDETFALNITGAVGALVTDSVGYGTITNDDTVALPAFSIGDASIVEGNSGTSYMNFTVQLSSSPTADAYVEVTTADGTATAGSDYTYSDWGLYFHPGDTSVVVQVPISGDTASEGNETFVVNLHSATGATIADAQAVGTITNDDAGSGPTLSIGDVTIAEGNSLTKTATFTVTLSAAQPGPVLFDVATANGTATAGSDYVAKSTTGVRIAAGATSKAFTVTINGDTTSEPDETFLVNLGNASGATIADGQGVGTIANDDNVATPTISITDATLVEGNSGNTFMNFTVSLSQAAASTVTYNAATSDGTATANSDYVAQNWGLNFPAGSTTLSLQVPVIGDSLPEPDETFTINLSNVVGATIADGQGTGTITNDDSAGAPYLSINDATLAEGNSGTNTGYVLVTLTDPAPANVSFTVSTSNGTATAGVDYVAMNAATQTILAGQTSVLVPVGILGDTLVDPNETFNLAVANVTGATVADGSAVVTIFDEDAPVGPTLSINDVAVTEGNSSTKTLTFTVSLSAAQSTAVTFNVATADGTATAGSDYVAKSTVGVRIPAGATSKTFAVTINGDTAQEVDETFTVNLSAPSAGITISDGQATGTIINDDAAATPTLSIADASVSEGNSGTKTLTFTVSLAPAAAGTVTYNIATSNGTATAGSDYVASSLTGQTISAGATSKTFVVTINGDTTSESDETFNVTLSNVSGATLGDGTAVGTISNDDSGGGGGPTLSIADVSIAEGNSLTKQLTFTVSLSAPASTAVTYNIATADGTALAGTDYTAKTMSGQSIAAGATSKTFVVVIKGDKVVEPNETFLVNVTNVVGATVADGQAVGTITNDDVAALTIARFDAKGLVDDVDDGNRELQLTARDYATLLLDSAQQLCRRAPNATVIAVEGVEHKQVLADLAEAANAACANAPRYDAVMADEDSRGFLIEMPAKGAIGTAVLSQPEVNAAAKSTTLSILGAGHATPVTLVLADGTNAELVRQLQLRAKADPAEALVLLGANAANGTIDLTAREFGQSKLPLPTERVLVNPVLLKLYGRSDIELAPLPANEAPAQQLRLEQ